MSEVAINKYFAFRHTEETVEICQVPGKDPGVTLSRFILVLYAATAATIGHFVFSKQSVSSKSF